MKIALDLDLSWLTKLHTNLERKEGEWTLLKFHKGFARVLLNA
jgi:hypothetical protein